MTKEQIIHWLLEGDVSIQYQTYRDLLDQDKPRLRNKINSEGWGLKFLSKRHKNAYWGQSFYQPKWISTHYTLLDLKNLNISSTNKLIKESVQKIFNTEKGPDGGIRPIGQNQKCDVCINGMVLNYSTYFGIKDARQKKLNIKQEI